MNTEDKGFCHLKKGLCTKDVGNAHGHTLSCQDYSSSCSAALHLLQGRGWEQECSRTCFAPVYSLALPSGDEYLAVQKPWDHEQPCNFRPLRFSQQGLSLSPANPLQLFLVYASLGILELYVFNTSVCMLWRETLADASFNRPCEVLQEVHTDSIVLSTTSSLTELNMISFPERCQFPLLDQVPVPAQLINSFLLWKDKGLPYAHTNMHTGFFEPEIHSVATQANLFDAVVAYASWTCAPADFLVNGQ